MGIILNQQEPTMTEEIFCPYCGSSHVAGEYCEEELAESSDWDFAEED